jgi:predicted DNA-binding WGR domain protein
MNSLTKGIESAIKNAIEEYVQCISQKYEEIDIDDLEELWNDVSKSMKISVTMKSPGKATTTKTNSVASADPNGCPYKFIKGTKQDTTCGAKAKEGNVYCSRHKKYEGTEPKERKSSPDPKRSTVKHKKSESRSPVKSTQRVLRKNKKLDKLWHPETGLVFKSANERTVVGKCVDDKLIDLAEEDIEECRKWGFSFVPLDEDEGDESSDDEKSVVTTPKERFIYMEAPSSSSSGKKFWECKVVGKTYTTCHGKVGKDGSTKEKTFESFDLAAKEMDKMIKAKSKKGYEETPKKVSKKKESPKKVSKKKESPKKVSKKKESNDSFRTPSDIEDALNELQGTSSDEKEEELEDFENAAGKKFIPNALGLSGKAVAAPPNDEDDDEDDYEEEEMLIEEFEEDE